MQVAVNTGRPVRSAMLRYGSWLCCPLVVLVLGAASARADTSPLLTTFSELGTGAGQTNRILGLDSDAGGHIFASEFLNNRISEFTPWGQFVKAWGWGVADGVAKPESCGPGAATPSCQQGVAGSGPGQLNRPNGVAVDPSGNVYVFEWDNLRVQKFSPSGAFLLMFGGEVNKTTGGNVCTQAQVEGGDTCGSGISGTEPGYFGIENVVASHGSYIAAGPEGSIYVGDKNRIQVFDSSGAYQRSLPLPEAGNPGALAIDPVSGDLYFAFVQGTEGQKPGVYRLSATSGSVLAKLAVQWPIRLATDGSGNVYVATELTALEEADVLEFDPAGDEVASCCAAPPREFFERQKIGALGTKGSRLNY